jgi:cobalamin biosynthesis protein CobD/CbiB
VAGFPALTFYAALSAMVWRFGRKGETAGFAVIPLALEKIMGIVPSIISAVLLTVAASITPTAMMSRAMQGFNAHKNAASYAFGGLPLTVLTWALDISVGGPMTDLDGNVIKGQWVGPEKATAQLTSGHLHRAVYLVIIASILALAIILGLMVISGNHLLDF